MLLLGLAAVTFLVVQSDRHGSRPASSAHDATAALKKLTVDPSSLVPDDQKGSFSTALAIPEGSTITVEERSWKQATPTSGTIFAKLASPGLPTVEYLITMAKQSGRWKVLLTIPVSTQVGK